MIGFRFQVLEYVFTVHVSGTYSTREQGVVVSSTVLVLGGVYVVLVSGTTGSSVPVPALVFRSTVL